MMKTNQSLVITAMLLTLMTGCQEAYESPTLDTTASLREVRVYQGIDTTAVVPTEKAAEIALLQMKQTTSSRFTQDKEVDSVSVIQGDDNTPLMYVVSFKGAGYVIVSATKKFSPVLAYSESGRFEPELGGIKEWLAEEKVQVMTCINDTTVSLHPEWIKYSVTPKTYSGSHSRSAEDAEDVQWWWEEFACELTQPDYHSNYEDYVGATGEVVGNWCSAVGEVRSLYPEWASLYDQVSYLCTSKGYREEDAIYHLREFENLSMTSPLLSTNWHQESPYNFKLGDNKKVLGCATIAVAQVMNYHRYPSSYDWDGINVNWSDVQGNFFKNLGESLGIDYNIGNVGVSSAKMQEVLAQNGYQAVLDGNEISTSVLQSELSNHRPVILSGMMNNTKGHAWVCDGYKKHAYTTIMTIYIPSRFQCPDDRMITANPFEALVGTYETHYSPSLWYMHMNWGWGASYNSWNRYGNYKAPESAGGMDYCLTKKYITATPNN